MSAPVSAPPPNPFDNQAADFGQRAGLPAAVRARIARAILDLGLGSGALLDIGAGTGEIGLELCQATSTYIGLDDSAAMLAEFRGRGESAGAAPRLVLGDARLAWPVAERSCRLVFGSRSLHWLEPGHVADEWCRVRASADAPLVIGRVRRDPESPRERIRSEMRRLLREAGFETRSGRRGTRALLEALVERGATPFGPEVIAEWTVVRPPSAALSDWSRKAHLAGIEVPDAVKADVLARTARFTAEAFGNIDEPLPYVERYTLEGARGPADSPSPSSP